MLGHAGTDPELTGWNPVKSCEIRHQWDTGIITRKKTSFSQEIWNSNLFRNVGSSPGWHGKRLGAAGNRTGLYLGRQQQVDDGQFCPPGKHITRRGKTMKNHGFPFGTCSTFPQECIGLTQIIGCLYCQILPHYIDP